MKILEINKFHNAKRGADKHYLDVTRLLEQNGHEVASFAMQQTDNAACQWSKYFLSTVGYGADFSVREKIKGIGRMFFSLEAHKKINKLLDDFQPDLVHIHNIYHQMDPTILFAIKKRGIPIVMTVHDFKLINPNHSMRLHGQPYLRCADGKYYQCFLDKAVKNSYAKSFLAMLEMYWHAWLGTYRKNVDLYIAPSNFVKHTLAQWGIDEEKIQVLPHFSSEALPNAVQIARSTAENYAIYPGKISHEKGVDTLIRVFSGIQNMKLYLAGEIENGYALPKSENIVHLGFVPAHQLQEYLRGSTCVVSGSQLPETFGLICLEAMDAGKPFVGFNTGAFAEIIVNGVNGFLAQDEHEFKHALEKIIADKDLFSEAEIKKQSQKFSAQTYAQKINAIFQKLASRT